MDLSREQWTYTDGVQLHGVGKTPEEAREDFLAQLTKAYDELYERISRIQEQIAAARRV